MYFWIEVANRLDTELEHYIEKIFDSDRGVVSLESSRAEIMIILKFSAVLLEKCASRTIYNSVDVSQPS